MKIRNVSLLASVSPIVIAALILAIRQKAIEQKVGMK